MSLDSQRDRVFTRSPLAGSSRPTIVRLLSCGVSTLVGGWFGIVAGVGIGARESGQLSGAIVWAMMAVMPGALVGLLCTPATHFALRCGAGLRELLVVIGVTSAFAMVSATLLLHLSLFSAVMLSTFCYVFACIWAGNEGLKRAGTPRGAPSCVSCGYSLAGLESSRCPECGVELGP